MSPKLQLIELGIDHLVRPISLDGHESERPVERPRRGHLGDGPEAQVVVAERACVRDEGLQERAAHAFATPGTIDEHALHFGAVARERTKGDSA